jgi:pyridinium-3,5-bisthiocarboxylic acid mononucleotide nickel chelatase
MPTCYFDPFSGISGDMTVGALIDAGADARALMEVLDTLGTGAQFEVEKSKRRGIAAAKFHVRAVETKSHRHLPHIVKIIEASAMPEPAKQKAIAVFRRLGEAEAQVHGVPIEKVHFHEVGAVDSICDIAGACTALYLLNIDEIVCAPVNVGSGTVDTEHGVLPVPAPATALLLQGRPIYSRGPAMELTTPTGAALVSALASEFGPMPPMRIAAIGYGAGDRDFKEHANVLRAIVGERTRAVESTTVSVIEANIDDSTAEVLGYAMERLFEGGALDVAMSPLFMKKNRAGTMLTVLARPEDQENMAAIIFQETSTLGLRIHTAERRVQDRRFQQIDLGYGVVRMKVAQSGAFSPEYDDVRAVALASGKPLQQVIADANLAYLKESR